MARWKALAGVALLFCLGFLAGSLATSWYFHRNFMPRPDRFLTAMESHMVAALALTPEQRAVLEDAIRVAQSELRGVIDRAKPEVGEIIRRAQEKLVPVLTADQLERLKEFQREGERIRRKMEEEEQRSRD